MHKWREISGNNFVVGFVNDVLRGFGQVFFQNSPISGALFLIGLFVGGWAMGGYALLAVAISTLTAYWLGISRSAVSAGLFGYNAALVGVALNFYLADNSLLPVYVIFGGFASCIVAAAVGNLLAQWGVPALTGPFVVTIWIFALGIYGFTQVEPSANSQAPALPTLATGGRASLGFEDVYTGIFKGVSEVYFQNSIVIGVIFLLGILASSHIDFFMALAGSIIGLGAGWVLGVDENSLALGLMGYNGVLTMIALGGLFYLLDVNSLILAALAVIASVIVSIALTTMVTPYGGHIYTAPFVLTTYGFIAAGASLKRLQLVPPSQATTPEGNINLYRDYHWWERLSEPHSDPPIQN
jgi:urea transporter